MRKRRRRGAPEINMTSLLDVLFCILFIVMLTSAQNVAELQASKEADTAEFQATINEKNAELAQLAEDAEKYKTLAASLELYKTESVVASLRNEVTDGRHTLVFTREGGESTVIPLGTDNMANALLRLEACIDPLLNEANGRPLYLVFACTRTQIYTEEFYALDERLLRYQSEHKEIFYKVTDSL